MITVDNYVRKLQDQIRDLTDQNNRAEADLESGKKKYQEAKVEAQTAYKGLESYQVILTKFEENMKIV